MDMGKVDESIFLFKSRRSQQREKEEKWKKRREGGIRSRGLKELPLSILSGFLFFFSKNLFFPLIGPLLFCDKKTEQRHLTIEIDSASSKHFLNNMTFQIDFNRDKFFLFHNKLRICKFKTYLNNSNFQIIFESNTKSYTSLAVNELIKNKNFYSPQRPSLVLLLQSKYWCLTAFVNIQK
jgi:hypothetical protein